MSDDELVWINWTATPPLIKRKAYALTFPGCWKVMRSEGVEYGRVPRSYAEEYGLPILADLPEDAEAP